MKNFLSFLLFFVVIFTVNAQESTFGITAGYANLLEIRNGDQFENSVTLGTSGFYLGMLTDISISEMFHLQPEIYYTYADEVHMASLPVLAKIYVLNTGLYFLGGPQLDLLLNDYPASFITRRLGVSLGIGLGYDLSQNFFLNARYSFGLTNRFDDDGLDFTDIPGGDIKTRLNALNIGIGYKF